MAAMALSIFAQAPQKMSYQCVIRNASGVLVTNQSVGIRISILQGTTTGTTVYLETYNPNPQTNANGLISLEIGGGMPITGTFSTINWASGPYFLKTETDPTGGTNYTIMGTSQLLSVPYALHAKTAENGFSGNYNDLSFRPLLFDGTWISLTGKPTLFNGSYTDLTDKPTLFNGIFASLTDKPNTVAGYGITNAITTEVDPTYNATFNITGGDDARPYDYLGFGPDQKWVRTRNSFALIDHKHSVATPGGGIQNNGFMSGADKMKLDAIDGSETKIIAGPGVTITGNGTTATPYTVNVTQHVIGEAYGGGRVFYVYDNGQHGLIVALNDAGNVPWCNSSYTGVYVTQTNATSDGINAGIRNTDMIIAAYSNADANPNGLFAAKMASDYFIIIDGIKYSGWYLPSMYELNLLYLQKNNLNLLFQTNTYWSSNNSVMTSDILLYAWNINFMNGAQSSSLKTTYCGIRPIKSF